MKLSIVIITWNDMKVLPACLASIKEQTRRTEYEIVISDNGSNDGCVEFVRANYPQATIVENKANLGYARGNNTGIACARGDYILILNPDTTLHEGALDKWLDFADRHPEGGAFGCKVLNPDGTLQDPARPFPTNWLYFQMALWLRGNRYAFWRGNSERAIDWQSGCAILFRGDLLKRLGGFDPRFFYHFEEVDLCYRVWRAGGRILYTPDAVITHLGGQSVGRFPIKFEIEKYRNRYRYFHKHFGLRGAKRCRWISLLHLRLRRWGYGLIGLVKKGEVMKNRLEMLRVVGQWNKQLDVARFIQSGAEPDLGYPPLMPAPKVAAA
jgi:GT2 family glycosyltransferase